MDYGRVDNTRRRRGRDIEMVRFAVYTKDSTPGNLTKRCEVGKWECSDKMMGENRITFSIESHYPIDFEVGDWCEFRGETYTMNVEPTCTQKARPGTHGQAFTYEVRLDSASDDLTRCTILDIIPTSGEHKAAYGTNYTGSANFSLNCFETTFVYQGKTIYYAPVHALLDRIKANLDRLYPDDGWQIYIDDSKCHTDDYIITFSNWTASQALAEVHNTFKLDFVVRGRKILVGDISSLVAEHPELEGLTGYVTDLDAQDDPLYFGYGMGYLSEDNQGKSLFQIKKIAKSDQQIVTRLRAVGSTKNMPYRYYHKTYGTAQSEGERGLPQTMFVQNLQLPDTFVPYQDSEAQWDKVRGNAQRDETYAEAAVIPNHVLGESNDAYIDKGNDAASCPEGIREGTARWDGSDSGLPEIYPTIEGVNYRELRANNVPDMDGTRGGSAFPHYLPYGGDSSDERVDEILRPGSGTQDDCNVGDGIMTDSEAFGQTAVTVPVTLQTRTIPVSNGQYSMSLFNISQEQEKGDYILSYTTQKAVLKIVFQPGRHGGGSYLASLTAVIAIIISETLDGGVTNTIATYNKTITSVRGSGSYSSQDTGDIEFILPDFHDQTAQEDGWSTDKLSMSARGTVSARINVTLTINRFDGNYPAGDFSYRMGIEKSDISSSVAPNAIWSPSSSAAFYSQTPFHLTIKDVGIDFSKISSLDGQDMVISMKSGQCAGREFTVKQGSVVVYQDTTGRKGWTFELDRVVDDSIHTYFPSANNRILAGDQFVLLNIELPDAYIRAAEMRLLVAATQHLADNCETKYTYQPSVDDIYLQRNIDAHAEDPENSVFWRLRSGMKFPFYGIPDDSESPLPVADITIEQVVIRMGDKLTPQVEVTLNNDIEQSMIQKMQISVDRIYGSIFNTSIGVSAGISTSAIHQAFERYFLSKVSDDVAQGYISFAGGINVQTLAEIAKAVFSDDIRSTSYSDDFTGSGWKVDASGHATVESLTVRGAMRVFELLVQQVRATGGEIIVSPANGRIKSVSSYSDRYVIEIDSKGNRVGNMFVVNDLVRCQIWNKSGNSYRSYWTRVTSSSGNTIEVDGTDLRAPNTPQIGDELVLMGNTTDTTRQGVISIAATDNGRPRITVLNGISSISLAGCTRVVLGDLSGITDEDMGVLEDYGLYSDNVYLKGKLAMSNGTLISDELTNIKSGEITLDAEKTIVPNDLEVHRVNTIPDPTTVTIDGETVTNNAHVSIHGSVMEVFNAFGDRNIQFGVDDNGYAVLRYYDNTGKLLYDLGPEGLRTSTAQAAGYKSETYSNHGVNGGAITVYQFHAKINAGQIVGESGYTYNDNSFAAAANGRYFASNSKPVAKDSDTGKPSYLPNTTCWNASDDQTANTNLAWRTVDELKAILKGAPYNGNATLVDGFNYSLDSEGKLVYDINIRLRYVFQNGRKTSSYLITQTT